MIVDSWLSIMCRMLPKATRGLFISNVALGQNAKSPGSGRRSPTAYWPSGAIKQDDLLAAAQLSANRKAKVISISESSDQSALMVIAYPLSLKGLEAEFDSSLHTDKHNAVQDDASFFGVVVIELQATTAQQSVVVQLLDWGQEWLCLLHDTPSKAKETNAAPVLNCIKHGFEQKTLHALMTGVATTAAQELMCDRVSIGLVEGDSVHVKAISFSGIFDARTQSVRLIEEAMAEAKDKQELIVVPSRQYPPELVKAHLVLQNTETRSSICSVPLFHLGTVIGIITFESPSSIDSTRQQQFELIGELLGPLIAMKKLQQQSLTSQLRLRLSKQIRSLLGKEITRSKMALATLVGIIAILTLVSGDFRVSAPVALEGRIQRAIVAPFDSYIENAYRHAGETVTKEQVIAELDDSDLQLEIRRLESQRAEFTKQFRKELAVLNHAQTRIVKSRLAQVEAQLSLAQENLQRTRLAAPIDGIIIEGDLSRSLGVPVKRGQVLFEIAPLDEYRVILDIDERDITHVKVGQKGLLSLYSQPNKSLPIVIQQVSPVFEQRDGKVSYRTEASIAGDSSILKPGMRGIAKISIAERSLGWQLTRRSLNWLRYKAWSLIP